LIEVSFGFVLSYVDLDLLIYLSCFVHTCMFKFFSNVHI